jgi:hypothetical protein
MSKEDIKEMMRKIPFVVKNKQLEIMNPNQGTFIGSRIIGKFYPEMEKGLLVIKSTQKDFEEIFDAFYREEKRFNKLR